MEITGHDLVVFTFARPQDVFARFFEAILRRWPDAFVEDTNDHFMPVAKLLGSHLPKDEAFLIVYRDSSMFRHMEEFAYAPMPDGDGPFAIITRYRRNVEFVISELEEKQADDHTPGGSPPPDPYAAWLCTRTILEVTAVTPGDPDELPFASWVLEELKRACRDSETE